MFFCFEQIFWNNEDFRQFRALKLADVNFEFVKLKAEKFIFLKVFELFLQTILLVSLALTTSVFKTREM